MYHPHMEFKIVQKWIFWKQEIKIKTFKIVLFNSNINLTVLIVATRR